MLSCTLIVFECSNPVADGGVSHFLLRMCLDDHGHHLYVPNLASFKLSTGLEITLLASGVNEPDVQRLVKLLANLSELALLSSML